MGNPTLDHAATSRARSAFIAALGSRAEQPLGKAIAESSAYWAFNINEAARVACDTYRNDRGAAWVAMSKQERARWKRAVVGARDATAEPRRRGPPYERLMKLAALIASEIGVAFDEMLAPGRGTKSVTLARRCYVLLAQDEGVIPNRPSLAEVSEVFVDGTREKLIALRTDARGDRMVETTAGVLRERWRAVMFPATIPKAP